MLNVFNLIQWRFDLLIPAQSPHSGVNVNPRMATLTRGSPTWNGKPTKAPRLSRAAVANCYTGQNLYRGFESLPLRQFTHTGKLLSKILLPPLQRIPRLFEPVSGAQVEHNKPSENCVIVAIASADALLIVAKPDV